MAEEDTPVEEDEGPKQTIKRLPPDTEVGPFFPSGMSAPEAAMAGATAGMSDDDKAKIDEMRQEYAIEGVQVEEPS